jgi:hypothetical protein
LDRFGFLPFMLRFAAQSVRAARWWRWSVEGGVPSER